MNEKLIIGLIAEIMTLKSMLLKDEEMMKKYNELLEKNKQIVIDQMPEKKK